MKIFAVILENCNNCFLSQSIYHAFKKKDCVKWIKNHYREFKEYSDKLDNYQLSIKELPSCKALSSLIGEYRNDSESPNFDHFLKKRKKLGLREKANKDCNKIWKDLGLDKAKTFYSNLKIKTININ